MFLSFVKSLRFVLIIVVLLVVYGGYKCLNLPANIVNTKENVNDRSRVHDKFLFERSNLNKSFPGSPLSPEQSSLNIYFTVRTTPGNYEKKIRPLQISWLQKVSKGMVSSVFSAVTPVCPCS